MPTGPRRLQGFTLIELMVVATVIGVSVIAFTPSFIFAMADRRASSAALEVSRVGRRARSEALGTQRAHLVWIRPGFGGTGAIQLFRGLSAQCDIQPWLTLSGTCPAVGTDNVGCLENIDLNDTHWFHSPFQIRLRTIRAGRENALPAVLTDPEEIGTTGLCYEPTGTTQWMVGALADPTVFNTLNAGAAAGGALLYSVGLFNLTSNSVVGTPRVIAYPLGSTPRKLR
jgi:prepilin-type N-terminal cleavage/methylation domain-containing protein